MRNSTADPERKRAAEEVKLMCPKRKICFVYIVFFY